MPSWPCAALFAPLAARHVIPSSPSDLTETYQGNRASCRLPRLSSGLVKTTLDSLFRLLARALGVVSCRSVSRHPSTCRVQR